VSHKDKIGVSDVINVQSMSPAERLKLKQLLADVAVNPCPKCGKETRPYKSEGSCPSDECPHEKKKRICTSAKCRNVFEE